MSGKPKYSVFPLVAGAVLVITGVISGITISDQNAALDAQQAELAGITANVDNARSASDAVVTEASLGGPGANADRVAADRESIGELLDRALSWDSHATYSEARASTMRVYGITEDSAFMTSFLPEAPVNLDSEGNEYPYIDAAGLNSQVGDFTAKLLSVDVIDYSYMVLVDVQATSSDGLGTAVNVATVFVTIDGEGELTKISGFASTTPPRTSE